MIFPKSNFSTEMLLAFVALLLLYTKNCMQDFELLYFNSFRWVEGGGSLKINLKWGGINFCKKIEFLLHLTHPFPPISLFRITNALNLTF